MFSIFKEKKELPVRNNTDIVAPVTGKLIPASELSDQMFREEMMGQTIGIMPTDGTVCSPANGILEVLYPTGHAFAVRRSDQEGILVHIGIDTVNLKGRGFRMLKKQGDPVKAGEPIVIADLNTVKEAGLDSCVMLVITEPAEEGKKETYIPSGSVAHGEVINQ
ncbi:MAG: PTS glucose transporter subunit IIA [Solobacterium sp.]|jgi:glucose-specific phosphotransferase system IIA component|nr:PTS glucose transporter subunit IIA [Solobacterium sp.]MCH4206161.1 PTS glucose transporter subunit IIA [Solobacterium sp.]MCH4227627.1 PTS glucose transporter subunit IIA [Solobacterium sp.]MCH4282573.1 PTS glucose transporter subunit IIA [Solobacterium sp.]